MTHPSASPVKSMTGALAMTSQSRHTRTASSTSMIRCLGTPASLRTYGPALTLAGALLALDLVDGFVRRWWVRATSSSRAGKRWLVPFPDLTKELLVAAWAVSSSHRVAAFGVVAVAKTAFEGARLLWAREQCDKKRIANSNQ
jgi:hypothetical protein